MQYIQTHAHRHLLTAARRIVPSLLRVGVLVFCVQYFELIANTEKPAKHHVGLAGLLEGQTTDGRVAFWGASSSSAGIFDLSIGSGILFHEVMHTSTLIIFCT